MSNHTNSGLYHLRILSAKTSARRFVCGLSAFAITAAAVVQPVSPEIVQLINGDRYSGKVVSVDARHVEFESEIQGKIQLPREKVALIIFREDLAGASTAPAKPAGEEPLGKADDVLKRLQKDGVDAETMEQLQKDLLGGNPQANQKFNEMVRGLMSGQLSVQDIRKQAQDSAKQLRELKGELGEDADGILDGYLTILEGFLQETEPAKGRE